MKHKSLRILILAVVISLLLLTIPATPAAAQTVVVFPVAGTVGTTVSVTGSGFVTSPVYVFFGDFAALPAAGPVLVSGGLFSTAFLVPAGTATGITYVIVRNGPLPTATVLAVTTFTVTARIVTVSPLSGNVGSTVTVNGSGFTPGANVDIYFDATKVTSVTASATGSFTGATFLVPQSYRGTHIIKGRDAGGESPGVNFTVIQGVTVSPVSGNVGDIITITGTGFAAYSNITFEFNSLPVTTGVISTNVNGSFTNSAFTIPHAPSGSRIVAAEDASGNSATASFTVLSEVVINPTTGSAGTTVTVGGTGFNALATVTIRYNNVIVTTSPTSILSDVRGNVSGSFSVPAGAAGTYLVQVSDGTNTASAPFVATFTATISEQTTEASPGFVGMTLTISGTGFRPNATVTITYTSTEVTLVTVTSDANGAFFATVMIPPSDHGNHVITVSDGLSTKQFTFVMESQPPATPGLLVPAEGVRVEKQTEFDWDDVTDPSGVTYTFEIARDESFNNLLLQKPGLIESEYTLTEAEEIPSSGTKVYYYWRVRAVDRASNESAWSAARSFYMTYFPDWVKYTLIGVGALALAGIAFWVGFRTGRRVLH